MQYPTQAIGGGAMYAVQLPATIPAAGTPGGPPASNFRMLFQTFPREPRIMFQELIRDPDKLPAFMRDMQAKYQAETEKRRKNKK